MYYVLCVLKKGNKKNMTIHQTAKYKSGIVVKMFAFHYYSFLARVIFYKNDFYSLSVINKTNVLKFWWNWSTVPFNKYYPESRFCSFFVYLSYFMFQIIKQFLPRSGKKVNGILSSPYWTLSCVNGITWEWGNVGILNWHHECIY